MASAPPRLLVLYADYVGGLSYYDDWVDAFRRSPLFGVRTVDLRRWPGGGALARWLAETDLVVVLHSLTSDDVGLGWLQRAIAPLQGRRCPLLVFLGNEVNVPSCSMTAKMEFLRRTGAQWAATMLPLAAGRWLYAECPATCVVGIPHGLNPAAFPPGPPHAERPLDLGVRSDRYPVFLGDDQRNRLFELVANYPYDPPLRLDVRLDQRLDRTGWAALLASCRATVADEAGASYLERDDRTVKAILAFAHQRAQAAGQVVVRARPGLWKLGQALPAPLKRWLKALLGRGPLRYSNDLYKNLTFAEVHERFFQGRVLSPVSGKHMTSRHFDAAGAKTCQILVRGHYNGILQPDRHYLALDADFGNFDEVLARFRDPGQRQGVAEAAYQLVMQEHTVEHRLATVRALLG